MRLHLVDGTYELFRAYYGAPKRQDPNGAEVGATVGLLASLLVLLRDGDTTHVACAFDHVIRSFRNTLFAGYKTGEGIEPELRAQFRLAEEGVAALGVVVWPMVEYEADDALATAAARWGGDARVEQVIICSPDKDLAQCVRGSEVVCLDRRRQRVLDESGVVEKFGVPPDSIPDWLALVGDSADGIPGIRGWGRKSASRVLSRYRHLEGIPDRSEAWDVDLRTRARALADSLRRHREEAVLYRRLATLRTDVPLSQELGGLAWKGAPGDEFEKFCAQLGDNRLPGRLPFS